MSIERWDRLGPILGAALLLFAGPAAHAAGHGATPAPQQEAGACAGVPAEWRSTPLLRDRQVLDVREIAKRTGKAMWWRIRGAEVVIAARPGDSAPWLRRVLRCELAAATAEERATSPLGVPSAKVAVHEAGEAFAVRVTSDRLGDARLILQRASKLRVPTTP